MIGSGKGLEDALGALGELLDHTKTPPCHIAVCGGAGLFALGLMTRPTTKDVDVFAFVEHEPAGLKFLKAKPFPDWLNTAALRVAGDLNLEANWINPGPTSILDFGLPIGLASRLHRREFGKRLVVYFIDRPDQICFKLYAAVDQGPTSRHMADLIALKPTAAEMETAARWTLTHDDSEGFILMLRQCLELLGFGDVARRI